MKLYHQIFLLLISIAFFNSCVSTKNFKVEKNNAPFDVVPLLKGNYKTALYNSSIDIGEKHFSGLFYFKTFSDSSYRIVFLSQFGLNLLDLKYKNNDFTVVNCQEFLEKKVVLNTLKKNLKLLLDVPHNYKKKVYKNTENKSTLVKLKKRFENNYFFYSKNGKIETIIQTNKLKHIELNVKKYQKNIPKNIEITNKRINLKMKFNLIKLK